MTADDDLEATTAETPDAYRADTVIELAAGAGSDSSKGARAVDLEPRELEALSYPERYQMRRPLGKGGMGEVNLAFDAQIGREIAVKVMLASEVRYRSSRERFMREARVQAQLEHPGVVPVYEMGVTPEGAPFFAMKRIKGTTLREVFRQLAAGDPVARARYPRRKLLSILERVVETVAYAHSRGVVHRDLKPDNVMLGDFGEVSVLDWGIARLTTETDLSDPSSVGEEEEVLTQAGAVVGTIGYMAPEQSAGDPVDERADVYSLGAILFEMVTDRRLHPGKPSQRRASTLRGVDARPSAYVEGVPEALDELCVRATETMRAKRYSSAATLLADLRAFLDGQRVTELRQRVAGEHAQAARLSLTGDAQSGEAARAEALRQLGVAAVLDPQNREMAGMIKALLNERTREVPPEVHAEMERHRQREASAAAGRSAIAYAVGSLALPLAVWMGVRDWLLFSMFACAILLSGLTAAVIWHRQIGSSAMAVLVVPVAFIGLACMSTAFGPLIMVPSVVAATAVALTVSQRAGWRVRALINACGSLAILVPLGLQMVGVLPPSYEFVDGALQVLPHALDLPEVPTVVFLTFLALFVVLVPNTLLGRVVEALRESELQQLVIMHRLKAMLPHDDG